MNNRPILDDAGLVVGGSAGILHGNSARIGSKKPLTSLWANVVNDHSDDRYGRSYHRLDGFDDDRCAELAKREVDSNPL
jgi:hypothetical protein